jgi:hypothetical protein
VVALAATTVALLLLARREHRHAEVADEAHAKGTAEGT